MSENTALIYSAEAQAQDRANREGRTMYVYLSSERRAHDAGVRLYAYVRNSDEGAPAGATLHATIHPQSKEG